MTFAVHRFDMNKGCGDRSGRWLFEEFMYTDCIFGSAVVEYDVTFHRPHKCDDAVFAPGENRGEIEISDAVPKNVVVFDDDGNSIPLGKTGLQAAEKIIMEAFEAIIDDVKVFESETLGDELRFIEEEKEERRKEGRR